MFSSIFAAEAMPGGRLPVRRRDAEAENVGELGIERGGRLPVPGGLLAACNCLDAAADQTDYLPLRAARFGNLYRDF